MLVGSEVCLRRMRMVTGREACVVSQAQPRHLQILGAETVDHVVHRSWPESAFTMGRNTQFYGHSVVYFLPLARGSVRLMAVPASPAAETATWPPSASA